MTGFRQNVKNLNFWHLEEILASTTRSDTYLFTLEALWQKEERPSINTKDEYKRHELTVIW